MADHVITCGKQVRTRKRCFALKVGMPIFSV
jgi:hypothetical protein